MRVKIRFQKRLSDELDVDVGSAVFPRDPTEPGSIAEACMEALHNGRPNVLIMTDDPDSLLDPLISYLESRPEFSDILLISGRTGGLEFASLSEFDPGDIPLLLSGSGSFGHNFRVLLRAKAPLKLVRSVAAQYPFKEIVLQVITEQVEQDTDSATQEYSTILNELTHGPKYKFTGEVTTAHGQQFYKIEREDGRVGGWIADESCLSRSGGCWVDAGCFVGKDARVSDNAWVTGGSSILGSSVISGNAWVFKESTITDSEIGGRAKVWGSTVSGSTVKGTARVASLTLSGGSYNAGTVKKK